MLASRSESHQLAELQRGRSRNAAGGLACTKSTSNRNVRPPDGRPFARLRSTRQECVRRAFRHVLPPARHDWITPTITSLKVGLLATPAAILIAVPAAYAIVRVSFLEKESLPQLSFADDRARRDSRDPALGALTSSYVPLSRQRSLVRGVRGHGGSAGALWRRSRT